MILYCTTGQRPSLDYSPVSCKDSTGEIYVAWVRAIVVTADPVNALDVAAPRHGETVLNTIEV